MEKSKLFTALSKAQAEVKAASKSGENKFDHYKYAMLQDYWDAVQGPMAKNGLSFPVSISAIERLPDRQTSKGVIERVVQVELTGYLCHESGEGMEFKCYGEGQDRSDKAIYKAVTGGKKYLLASVFNIPTTDDPEKDSDAERGDPMDQRRPEDRRPPQTHGNSRRRPLRTATQDTSTPPYGVKPEETQAPVFDAQNPNGFKAPPLPQREGYIGQVEYDSICTMLGVKKIKKLKWLAYIKEKYKVDTASDLKFEQYEEVIELIKTNPAAIDPGINF